MLVIFFATEDTEHYETTRVKLESVQPREDACGHNVLGHDCHHTKGIRQLLVHKWQGLG